jgi:hypothetical protein
LPLASHRTGVLNQPGTDNLLADRIAAIEVFRLFVASEELVDQFVAYGHGSSFWMFGSFLPFDRLHKILDTLTSRNPVRFNATGSLGVNPSQLRICWSYGWIILHHSEQG